MEEELAMLRHIIAHFHQFSSPSTPPPFYIDSPRCCFLNVDEISMEDEPKNMIISDNPSESKKPRKDWYAKASEGMDEEIWKDFPEDLLEAVLARLPIATFFRLRSVCRKWNSYLQSSSFSQHCAQVTQSRAQPWLYSVTNENVSLYDSFSRKWRYPTKPPHAPPKVTLFPVASAGGLVCLRDVTHSRLYVCNPVTQTWRELPARSSRVWAHGAIAMTMEGDEFKVVVVGDREFEVYDSLRNGWVVGQGGDMGRVPLSLNLWSQAVCVGATVYLLQLIPEGVVSYDTGRGEWRRMEIPHPAMARDARLAESGGGRLMLVGLLTKNAATCVCVWELQKMTLLWKEVDRMPNAWCLEFYGKYVTMTCLGNKGLLIMSLRSGQLDRLVTYDVPTGEWSKIPGNAAALTSGRRHSVAFYPRLTHSP